MIYDTIDNAAQYYGCHELFPKAFDFIRSFEDNPLPVGRYEIDGDRLYALVQTYTAQPVEQKKLEAHQKYIDIQYVSSGAEQMGHLYLRSDMEAPYNPDKDVTNYYDQFVPTWLPLTAGFYAILFPQDVHMPGVQLGEADEVIKVVLKVRV